MTKDIIDETINELLEDIIADKNRITKIIEYLEYGEDKNKENINDKLIENLNNITISDPDIDSALEYLIIILSNIETQNSNTNKNLLKEIHLIHSHLLHNTKKLKVLVGLIINDDNIESKPKSTNNKYELLKKIMPDNKMANTILWIIILISFVYTLNLVDNNLFNKTIHDTGKIITNIKGGVK